MKKILLQLIIFFLSFLFVSPIKAVIGDPNISPNFNLKFFGYMSPVELTVISTSFSIVSPYTPKTQSYKGQLHVHTIKSDGTNSPAEIVTYYKNKGYNFISLTDHSGNGVTQDPGISGILFILGAEQYVKIPNGEGGHLGRINAIKSENNTILPAQKSNGFIERFNGII